MAVLEAFAHLGDEEEQVGVLQGCTHEAHHLLVQLVVRVDDAWSVGVNYLEVITIDYTHDTFARRLGLACYNAQTLSNESVH